MPALHGASSRAVVVAGTLACALASSVADARRQVPPRPAIDLDRLIAQSQAQAEAYRRAFRNLTAQETKLIEVYDSQGRVEKRREIVSDLVVYQPARDGAAIATEYRDVQSVDGKPVKRRGERALALLTRAARAGNTEQELAAIDRETWRYEFHRHLRGYTISTDRLPDTWRQSIHFDNVRAGRMAGREVVEVVYRHVGPLTAMHLPVPKEFGVPTFLGRGTLWLDADTGQLWRSVSEVLVQHPAVSEPLVMLRRDSTYGPSRFGIPVPERIVWDWVTRFAHPKKGLPSFSLEERVTFTYAAYRSFDVGTTYTVPRGTR